MKQRRASTGRSTDQGRTQRRPSCLANPLITCLWFALLTGQPACTPDTPSQNELRPDQPVVLDRSEDEDDGDDADGTSTDMDEATADDGMMSMNDDADPVITGDSPVGSACEDSAECAGPGTPVCLERFRPLEGRLDPVTEENRAAVQAIEDLDIGLDFPGGFCSTDSSCEQDSDCGLGGTCFAPLRDVSEADLTDADLGLPFDVQSFSGFGLCMQACDNAVDCRNGWDCVVPIDDLLQLLPGTRRDQTYCVAPKQTGPCKDNPCKAGGVCIDAGNEDVYCVCPELHAGERCELRTDQPTGACNPDPCLNGSRCTPLPGDTFVCACEAGWSGDTCDQAVEADGAFVGDPCERDSECTGPGTPVCLQSFYPVTEDDFAPGVDDATIETFTNLRLDFPGGHCSTEGNCKTDSDCGTGGSCFYPLEAVSPEEFAPIADGVGFAPEPFLELGLCMRACTVSNAETSTSTDCRPGWTCEPPLASLIGLVPNADTESTYCVAPEQSGACEGNPCNGGVCSSDENDTLLCTCPAGLSGERCTEGSATGGMSSAAVDCGPLDAPARGSVNLPGSGLDATALYSCEAGYDLSGNASRSCQASGQWSGSAPACLPATTGPCAGNACDQGTCIALSGGGYRCSCSAGYTGSLCEDAVNCDLPSGDSGASLSTDGTTFGSTASYSCPSGQVPSPSATRSCQADGSWSGSAPECVPDTGGGDTGGGDTGGGDTGGGDGSSCGESELLVYDITGEFKISGTTLGAGDGTFDLPGTAEASGNSACAGAAADGQPIPGPAQLVLRLDADGSRMSLVSFRLPQNMYTSTFGVTVRTNTLAEVPENACGAALGNLRADTLVWDDCTPHPDYGSKGWTPSEGASGAGCAANWGSEGNVGCSGSCSLGGLISGDNCQTRDTTWDQPLSDFAFSADLGSFSSEYVDIPKDADSSRTQLRLSGSLASRTTETTPDCACP